MNCAEYGMSQLISGNFLDFFSINQYIQKLNQYEMILINEDQLDCGFSKVNTKWNQIHANKIMLPHDIICKNLQHISSGPSN